nr:hypothetical protein [Tanacetum cinerariifolium]
MYDDVNVRLIDAEQDDEEITDAGHVDVEHVHVNQEGARVADLVKQKKRSHDDADKDEGPSTRLDRGLNRWKISKDTKPSKKAKSTKTSKGPSYNILKGTCRSFVKLEYNIEECYKALIDKLDWNNPEVTNVKVKEWYGYGHLEEIEVRRSDQQLYKFMEGDFPRLHLHDIEDMLILFVHSRLFNLKGCTPSDSYPGQGCQTQ